MAFDQAIQVGAIFSSLSNLETTISQYKQSKFVNLYKRSSGSIESHKKRCPNVQKRQIKILFFAEINYFTTMLLCVHSNTHTYIGRYI